MYHQLTFGYLQTNYPFILKDEFCNLSTDSENSMLSEELRVCPKNTREEVKVEHSPEVLWD